MPELLRFTKHTPSTDPTLPDWYLSTTSGAPIPSIGDSLGLDKRASPNAVIATHPSSSNATAQDETLNGMGHMGYTLRGSPVSLTLRRHTHDAAADTYVNINLEPELHLGVLLPSKPGDEYELKMKDTPSDLSSIPFEQSILELFRQGGGFVEALWTKSEVQLTRSGTGNDDMSLFCSVHLMSPNDDPSEAKVDLLELHRNIKQKTGSYATSAQDIIGATRSQGLFWRPFILSSQAGVTARPLSTAPQMSATMSGPQELYFEHPGTQANEESWTPVDVLCRLRANVVP